jgi:hypothetical protein
MPIKSASNYSGVEQKTSELASEENDVKMEDAVKEEVCYKLEGLAKNTVVLFDYDDTLLASSFLSGKGYRLDTEMEKSTEVDTGLRELEQSVIAVLTLALRFAHVHIVTNAETGWVQLSAQKFMPGLVPLLSKVKIISARSTYENLHPDAPVKWKYCAFQDTLSNVFGTLESKNSKNVISFGDSHVEREAVRAVTRGVPNVKTKSVKFAERPSMEQLRRQIELVTNCFNYIYQHDGDLDLQLTVTVNASTPTSPSGNSGNNGNCKPAPMQTEREPTACTA